MSRRKGDFIYFKLTIFTKFDDLANDFYKTIYFVALQTANKCLKNGISTLRSVLSSSL